ncbi:uncharacterized protein LOC113959096 isoform X2 [Corapipo altera]|uniref:uncharacterized protein LOC113959096 isoform X2 n=1 Tax=Corapipo altera TaxID=415028 RepID=UPI000FD6B45E|nr:uncharacterized protein LOC113959096 isoform X2 [Corapipo altera]
MIHVASCPCQRWGSGREEGPVAGGEPRTTWSFVGPRPRLRRFALSNTNPGSPRGSSTDSTRAPPSRELSQLFPALGCGCWGVGLSSPGGPTFRPRLPGPENPELHVSRGTWILPALFRALPWLLSSPGCWDCTLGLSWHCWSGQDSQPWRRGLRGDPTLGSLPGRRTGSTRLREHSGNWEAWKRLFTNDLLTKGFPKPWGVQGQVTAPPGLGAPECGAVPALCYLAQAHPSRTPLQGCSTPFPRSLALEQPCQHPSTTSQFPVPLPSLWLWDALGLCRKKLFQTPANPRHPPRRGPGGDSDSPDCPHCSHARSGPPRALQHLLSSHLSSSGGATPWDSPAPEGTSPALPCLWICAFGFALLASLSRCRGPPALTPARQWQDFNQHFYPLSLPVEWSFGIGMDGSTAQA